MPTVPIYEPNVQTRPFTDQKLSPNASPEAFGAGIGRGMQSVARGLDNFTDAAIRVRELEDIARAKDADNQYAGWLREAQYGNGGFMTLEGKSAVDGRRSFEELAEQKRKEFGQGLTPGAAKAYQDASNARLQSAYQQSIVHTASERKTWFKTASASRVETFANDALVAFGDPRQVAKNIGAGIAELRQAGALEGWDADTLKLKESEFTSGVYKNITLRIAQSDPIAAAQYAKDHAASLTGAHQYDLNSALEGAVLEEQSKREAEAILSGGRKVSDLPGDIVAEVAGIQPEGRAIAGSTIGDQGPTRARAFLMSKTPGKGPEAVDGLDAAFATNLAAMLQDAPPDIREGLQIMSGYRSIERQRQLWEKSDKSGRMVARPGRSYHNHGQAADLMYNGVSLARAPANVKQWVHENASKYGMYFPMSWEPWHIEPIGTRGGGRTETTIAQRSDKVSQRAAMPSYDDIEARLEGIADPRLRDLTRKRLYAQIEVQSKMQEQNEKAAKAELWRYIDQGATPDQVPLEVRQDAGMAAVSSAWQYMETAAKGRAVQSDETLMYSMRRAAALDPAEFARIDLNDYRDRLSKDAIKELTGLQTTALTDERKAKEDGLTITSAFEQSRAQLEAVGLTTTGRDGSEREDAARRIAQFQNALAAQMDEFKRSNESNPSQIDIQAMINRLLLPVVIKTEQERSIWDPLKSPWTSTTVSETPGFLFESRIRPDGTSVDVAVKYEDIPIDLRRGIATDLENELGRKPSEEEVVQRYEDFVLNR